MPIPKWAKHALIGGTIAGALGPVTVRYLKDDKYLDEKQKRVLTALLIGTAGCTWVGYEIGDMVFDGKEPDGSTKKAITAVAGGLGGLGLSYIVGRKIVYRRDDDNELENKKNMEVE